MDPKKHHSHESLIANYKSFKEQFPHAVHNSKTNCVGILNVDNTEHLEPKIKEAQAKLIKKFDELVEDEKKNQKKNENPKTEIQLHVVGTFICKLKEEAH